MIIPQFPNSSNEPFTQTSHVDTSYNCIAWAANNSSQWFEPDPFGVYYWPNEIEREYTIEAYLHLYEFLGYERCNNGDMEEEFLKVAVFAKNGYPTHAARQLPNGNWTSKLGKNIDVEHTLFGISGGQYGDVIQFLKKTL